jgi:hypothetical protein
VNPHPVEPDAESLHDVFEAALEYVPVAREADLRERWNAAQGVQRRRRTYDQAWTSAARGSQTP